MAGPRGKREAVPARGRCRVTLTRLKHRRSGRSGVCGLSNARWFWHLERFSAPPPAQKLSISCAKLTRSLILIQSKGGRQGALPPPPLPVCARYACVPHLARHHDTQTPPTIAIVRWQACPSGWLPARERARPVPWHWQPSPTPPRSRRLFNQHR